MREKTYKIRKDIVNSDASLAKFFLFGAGIVLILTGLIFVYSRFVRTEPMTFYKDIDDCRVVTEVKTTRSRSNGKSKTYKHYYVYVYTPDGTDDVRMKVSRSYYSEMSKYMGVKNTKLSFFKTKGGSLFPSYTYGCSESKAGHQYVECYPSVFLETLLIIMAAIGGVMLVVGLSALCSFIKKNRELVSETEVSGIEYDDNNDEFMKEFDEAMQRDPYRRTRSPSSSRGNKPSQDEVRISAEEREEFLRQFDELTADGRYKYKTHD